VPGVGESRLRCVEPVAAMGVRLVIQVTG
jgi:hypothetical protein